MLDVKSGPLGSESSVITWAFVINLMRSKMLAEFSNNSLTDWRRYPLLYWTMLIYLVGVPNFVHFDETGRRLNPINQYSITLILQFISVAYLLVVILLLERNSATVRATRLGLWLWLGLMMDFVAATMVSAISSPTGMVTMPLLLSLFRIAQWVVAFVGISALYLRTPSFKVTELTARLIGRISWIWLCIVWGLLPLIPSQVYGRSDEDGSFGGRRLGGQLIQPGDIALLGSVAFFYSVLFFPKGIRRWSTCLLALLTIALTEARTQQAGFVMVLFLYGILLCRKAAVRWGMIGVLVLGSLVGIAFSNRLAHYVSRGENGQTFYSLNERTLVWAASLNAIRQHPIWGYGYSVGARNAIRDQWRFAHWLPPHAHNEFIQAALDGGIPAMLLLLFIYGRVLWTSVRESRRGPYYLFLLLVFLQFGVSTITGVEITYAYRGAVSILILCCVGVLAGAERRVSVYRIATQTKMHRIVRLSRGVTALLE